MKTLLIPLFALFLFSCSPASNQNTFNGEPLAFNELATRWDEAMPLGNGLLGCLVWETNGKLRLSLDRSDLWDLRPKENINFNEWKFNDVYREWESGNYQRVLKEFDRPSGLFPAPTKIPAGALEINIEPLGKVKSVSLDLFTACCSVEWESGARFTSFINAGGETGWYRLENIPDELQTVVVAPDYEGINSVEQNNQSLSQLGYKQGTIETGKNTVNYTQKGWGDFSYQINVKWETSGHSQTGCWAVSSSKNNTGNTVPASKMVENALLEGYEKAFADHQAWWGNYWAQSAISIPDSVLQKQYYLEMYKFGSAARATTAPISLQAVWTADNGQLPPWKGDFHHDLNTQLSYWPSYAGNQLELESGFVNWLWNNRPAFKKYTRDYFEVDGLNVPGVTTLEGEPMGGWIQYSLGQTVAAWLGQNFYQHWRFSMDRDFLKERTYPWLNDVATFFEQVSVTTNSGTKKLKISSSPEIYNNSAEAWFAETTNFDLALIRWTFEKAQECALELGLNNDAERWKKELERWPGYAVDTETGLMLAPGFPYNESHRHFSHLMGFHPLGVIDVSNGEQDKTIIDNTLKNLEKQGTSQWTGYSFSWQGNLYARAFDGEKAAGALRTFAECFCLKNSFHVNGDQCKAGHSNFTYRPFTLEGNFAFASAIQEMLLQSHTGAVRLFPAIPAWWTDVTFTGLRTYGAFLVSAERKNSAVRSVTIKSEKGGLLKIHNPFNNEGFKVKGANYKLDGELISVEMNPGQTIEIVQLKETV